MLLFHSRPQIRIIESAMEGLQNRRQRVHMEERGLPEAKFRTGDHTMLVDDGGHWHSSLRQGR